MPPIDIILIVIISGFALFGLWFGFVHTLGSLLGTLLGVFLATRYYEPFANFLIEATGWADNVSKVIVFIIAFIIINRLVGLAFWFIERFTNIFTKLPFIGSFNRMFGFFFGVLEGVVTVGVILYFIERFPVTDGIMAHISASAIAPYTVDVASLLLPLVPQAIKVLQSTVDYVETLVL